jgi:hypothetical protein
MGAKSRGNFKPGYDNGRDPQSYQTGRRERIVFSDSKNTRETGSHSIRYMVHRADDGSYFNKPISKAYYEHIKNRKSDGIKNPNQTLGDYGSGKKIEGKY